MSSALFCSVVVPLMIGPPATPPPAPDAGGETQVQPQQGTGLPPAIDAAFGVPSPDAGFTPDTTADPGFVERAAPPQADQVYGPTGQTVGPDGGIISGVQMYDEPLLPAEEGFADQTPEFHVVSRGDTLWDISAYYMGDPYAWPKVWSWNEHITNAHWIFPGDRVRLYDPGDVPRQEATGPGLQLTKSRIPEEAQQETYVLSQFGYVDADVFETSMRVTGGADAKVMMSTLDTIYMDYDKANPPIPGERLMVYAPQEKVYDVDNKTVIGYIVEVMGEVEVETIARKAVEGTVADALNPIERGYRVGPLRRRFARVATVPAKQSAVGNIVATLTSTGPIPIASRRRKKLIGDYVLAGDEMFVVTNLGKKDGVEVGNVLEVVRKGDEYTPKRVFRVPYEDGWPRRVTAAVLVVQVEEETSMGLVVYSRREVERGDHLELRGPGLGPDAPVTDERGMGGRVEGEARAGEGKAEAKGKVEFGK